MVFAGLRLARFNVQLVGFDKDHFVGLPVPMSALTIASFALSFFSETAGLETTAAALLPWLVILLSLLMVSKVRYDTLPKLSKRGLRAHPWRAAWFFAASVVVIASMGNYLFLVMIAFIGFGVLRSLYFWIRSVTSHEEKDADEEAEISSIDI
jgi:CDP-diacylglycerol--serine O-phosphatidyltransferase